AATSVHTTQVQRESIRSAVLTVHTPLSSCSSPGNARPDETPTATAGQTAAPDKLHPPSPARQRCAPLRQFPAAPISQSKRHSDCADSSERSASFFPKQSSSVHSHQSEIYFPAASESASPRRRDSAQSPPSDRMQDLQSPLHRPVPAPQTSPDNS